MSPTLRAQARIRNNRPRSWFLRWFSPGHERSLLDHPNRGEGALIRELSRRLITEGRANLMLDRAMEGEVSGAELEEAWRAIQAGMALVPAGSVLVLQSEGNLTVEELQGFYLDRYSVTNQQFQEFVHSNAYQSLETWPSSVWPSVGRFIDRTGRPGPRDWEHGKFPDGRADHPVVGVCWYEAAAYARWVGKRLPTAAEWQKAGGWPEHMVGGSCNRYPWGNMFDPSLANLAGPAPRGTVPVRQYPQGATPNGIYQMTGNVWEWLEDPLLTIPCQEDEAFEAWKPMRRIAGGSFRTYLPTEATCHFITGQGELDRRDNIGFRCSLSIDTLVPLPEFS